MVNTMLFAYIIVLNLQNALAAWVYANAQVVTGDVDDNDYDQLQALGNAAYRTALNLIDKKSISGSHSTSLCTRNNVKVRREWGALTTRERLEYIRAVKCLQSKPGHTPASAATGVKARFDDFVGTHINQTLTLHYTGNFLSWHRYYVWSYEQALQQECGFRGTQPYWDWAKTAITGFAASPIWDGSPTSMSGNGDPIPNHGEIVLASPTPGVPPLILPPGTGGGCVTSGPFANMTVNLGPVSLAMPGNTTEGNGDGLSHNPRCLKRDLTDAIVRAFSNATAVVNTILEPRNVYDFQMQMQGIPGTGNLGVLGGGHYAMGGDPGRDVFTSPGDPAFYLHHGMIDKTWWMWQMLDPEVRVSSDAAVAGTNTFLDSPPSANTTLDDYVGYGFAAGPPLRIRELMSTTSGPFCYVYA